MFSGKCAKIKLYPFYDYVDMLRVKKALNTLKYFIKRFTHCCYNYVIGTKSWTLI